MDIQENHMIKICDGMATLSEKENPTAHKDTLFFKKQLFLTNYNKNLHFLKVFFLHPPQWF